VRRRPAVVTALGRQLQASAKVAERSLCRSGRGSASRGWSCGDTSLDQQEGREVGKVEDDKAPCSQRTSPRAGLPSLDVPSGLRAADCESRPSPAELPLDRPLMKTSPARPPPLTPRKPPRLGSSPCERPAGPGDAWSKAPEARYARKGSCEPTRVDWGGRYGAMQAQGARASWAAVLELLVCSWALVQAAGRARVVEREAGLASSSSPPRSLLSLAPSSPRPEGRSPRPPRPLLSAAPDGPELERLALRLEARDLEPFDVVPTSRRSAPAGRLRVGGDSHSLGGTRVERAPHRSSPASYRAGPTLRAHLAGFARSCSSSSSSLSTTSTPCHPPPTSRPSPPSSTPSSAPSLMSSRSSPPPPPRSAATRPPT